MHLAKCCPQVKGNDSSPLLVTKEVTSVVLGPILGHPVQDRHRHTRESAVKGHKDDEGTGAPLLGGKAEKAATF